MKVLVLVVNGFHIGYIGCYGNDWLDTPNLDRLAAQGVTFDQHYADCPDAVGARRSWRSGCYQLPLPPGEAAPPAPSAPDLLARLKDSGVVTSLVIEGHDSVPDEFRAGWDFVAVVPPGDRAESWDRLLAGVRAALDQLDALDRWLLWLDLSSLLPPWDVPESPREPAPADLGEEEDDVEEDEEVEEDDEGQEEPVEEPPPPITDPPRGPVDREDDALFLRLQEGYGAAVDDFDQGLGLLLHDLDERGVLDELTLLLTSDRGRALGEHGLVGESRPWLHDELVHLPLFLCLPGAVEAGLRVAALTQSVDLFPTLLDLFTLPPAPVHGQSLLPLLADDDEPLRSYAVSGLQVGTAVEWALRTPEWAFVLPLAGEEGDRPRPPQLYVKPDDRWEVNNVLQHHLELTEHLEQVLRGFEAAARQPGPLQPPELPDVEEELAEPTGEVAEPGETPPSAPQ